MRERDKRATRAFGKVLRELREERGLTQEALALDVGTERSHISALERAEKGPALSTVFALARALGVQPADLISRVEAKMAKTAR